MSVDFRTYALARAPRRGLTAAHNDPTSPWYFPGDSAEYIAAEPTDDDVLAHLDQIADDRDLDIPLWEHVDLADHRARVALVEQGRADRNRSSTTGASNRHAEA